MKKLVLDSSVIIKWLNRVDEQDVEAADKLLDDIQGKKISIYVPYLVKFEIANALLKGKGLSIAEAADVLSVFAGIPLTYMDYNAEMMIDTYETAFNNRITFYDASFISLAVHLSCNLVTANPKDQKLKEKSVIALKNYR